MVRSTLALALSTVAMPALAADLFTSEVLDAKVQTSAVSFDLDTWDTDGDGLTSALFGDFPLTTTSTANTTAGSGSATAALLGARTMNLVEMYGSANASASSNSDGGAGSDAIAQFSFSFVLADAADYVLDWELATGGVTYPGFAMIGLMGSDGVVFEETLGAFGVIGGMSSGTLPAGSYTLYAMAFGSANSSGSGAEGSDGSFDLSFSVVPAPSAVGLLALAALTPARRRR